MGAVLFFPDGVLSALGRLGARLLRLVPGQKRARLDAPLRSRAEPHGVASLPGHPRPDPSSRLR